MQFTISVVFCISFAAVATSKPIDIADGGNTNLYSLGTVDGKTFFADASTRNWADSKTFCSDNGMRLATITSQAQWDLLISAYDENTTFVFDHWTAARDSHEPRQFTWDGLDTQPSIGEWMNFHYIGFQTCATFNPNPGFGRGMTYLNCNANARVICESIS